MKSLFCGISSAGLLLASLLAHAQQVPSLPGVPAPARHAAETIDGERIRAHVRFLASDLLEGRAPGTRGGQLAAEYIATQFALEGVRPAGENGTYFQRVPLMAVHTVEDQTSFSFIPAAGPPAGIPAAGPPAGSSAVGDQSKPGAPVLLKYGVDYVTKDQTGQGTADIDAPIVFAGYGIDAPEYRWNDFDGVDVRGKVLLVFVNEPPSNDESFFNGKALTYYGRWTYKYEEAARRGAVGVLLIHRADLASYGWDVVRNSQSTETSYLEDNPLATLRAASWIQWEVARKLLALAGLDLDRELEEAGKRGFKPIELPVRLRAHVSSRVRRYESDNVVGMVQGADSSPGDNVIYTAHYDHLGIDPSLPGDKIYNGAADNATGCGILLEIARAFAGSRVRPPHNVYFASVTAEEQGLLGSEYLAMHPPVPDKDLTLDLNFDELLPVGVPLSTEVGGAERTSFYPQLAKTAAAFDLEIQPDGNPMAGLYYRSDHFSFARLGVPAFSIGEGDLFAGHDPAWGKRQEEEYNSQRYHRPTDEYRPEMDFRGNAKMARFGFILGWEALSAAPVRWRPGDEFEAARKRSIGGGA